MKQMEWSHELGHSLKSKRRPKISAYLFAFFEYKRMRLFLSVYSSIVCGFHQRFGGGGVASCAMTLRHGGSQD